MARALTLVEFDLLKGEEFSNPSVRAELRIALKERDELLERVAELEGGGLPGSEEVRGKPPVDVFDETVKPVITFDDEDVIHEEVD